METRVEDQPRIAPDRLLDFAAAVYARAGMPEADARLAADTLVQADLWGHGSHGVLRLPWYAARLRTGACDPKAAPEVVADAGALTVLDGHAGMARVLTACAADEAVRRAKAHGIGAVGIRNSGHFGCCLRMYLPLTPVQGFCRRSSWRPED